MNSAQRALDQFSPEDAWSPFTPTADQPWDETLVAHFFRRTQGGASWDEIQAGLRVSPEELISSVLLGPSDAQKSDFERDAQRLRQSVLDSGSVLDLQSLWVYRLLYSPHPLEERLTLFWHDHFATSNAKVRSVRLMQRQNDLLRKHALGRFDELLREITFDPAMIVWLDSASNRKGQPNENYAREIMELFSLGVGHYTERDIQEAARALTGWSVKDEAAHFDPAQHDGGEKTIFGQTGHWQAGDVVEQCLKQPACALYLCRKLFAEFVSEAAVPSDALLAPLADGYRAHQYDTAWLMQTLLRSRVFFSPVAVHQRVKSPCDFGLGLVRALEARPNLRQFVRSLEQLGQNLYFPPSVKGWDGGAQWINAATLLKRQNIAFEVTRGIGPAARFDPARLARRHELSRHEDLARFFLRLFHQHVDGETLEAIVQQLRAEDAALEPRSADDRRDQLARSAAHLALTIPEFQLG